MRTDHLPAAVRRCTRLTLSFVAFAMAMIVAPAAAPAATGFVPVGAFGQAGPDGELAHQKRIAVHHDSGDVYVADVVNDRVAVYRPNGTSADLVTAFAVGEVVDPLGVAIDQNTGDVYVSDQDDVAKYDSDGAATPTFTLDPAFMSPAVTGPLSFDPVSDQLLVADRAANIVRRYGTTGSPGPAFDGSAGVGSPGAFAGLQDIAVDSTGDIVVVDSAGDPGTGAASRIERFDPTGTWEATIGPVDQAATVGVVPATDDVIVGGNQDAVDANEKPTLRQFAADGSSLGSLPVDDSVMYSTISGIAADDGAAGRLWVATDVSAGGYQGQYGLTSVQAYDLVQLPTVTVGSASDVAEFSATLNGTVNPEGQAGSTTFYFEYSGDGGASWAQTAVQDAGSGAADVAVSATIEGLTDDKEYRYRLVASRGAASATSGEQTFTTLDADPPGVTVDPVTEIDAESADITGVVDTRSFATSYRFEYSTDGGGTWTALAGPDGDPTTDDDAGNAPGNTPVQATIPNLQPLSGYQVRLIATNPAGTTESTPEAFTTLAAPPVVQTTQAGPVTGQTAKLNGKVDPQGSPTTYWFEYGLTTDYGTSIPATKDADAGSGNQPVDVARHINALAPGATYHYRIVATNSEGTEHGTDRTFTVPVPQVGDDSSPATRPGEVPGRGFLPDNRGWEKVTPEDKGGVDVGGDSYYSRSKVSADGNGFLYTSHGVFAGAPSGGYPSYYLAKRQGDRWISFPVQPQSVASMITGSGGAGRTAGVLFANDDLSTTVVETNAAVTPGAHKYVPNIFTRDIAAGGLKLMTTGGPTYAQALSLGDPLRFETASPDGRHVAFASRAQFTPDAPAGYGEKLYLSVDGDVSLAGVRPDGSPIEGAYAGGAGRSAHRALSDDGSRLYFTDAASSFGALYLRENGTTTEIAPPGSSSTFFTATTDGRYAIYRRGGATTSIYRFDAETGTSTELSVDDNPLDGADDPGVATVLAVSDDLERVYFVAAGDLVPGQDPTGAANGIYLWDNGDVRHIGTLVDDRDEGHTGPASDPQGVIPEYDGWINRRWASWTRDGGTLVFDTTARVTGYDSNGFRQVYRYDIASDEIECLSCPDGAATADATVTSPEGYGGGTWARPLGERNAVSADGEQVFFSTAASLVPRDTNGKLDVYGWRAGAVRLLSTGVGQFDARLLRASRDGSNVFFATRARLVGSDDDDLVDIYNARVGGGVPEPAATPEPCVGEECQGPVGGAPPARGSASDLDDEAPSPDGARARARFAGISHAARLALARGRVATIRVMVSRPGRVSLVARAKVGKRTAIVGRVSKTVARSGGVGLRLRLSRPARRALSKRASLRVVLRLAVTGQSAPQVLVVNLGKGR